MIVGLRLRLTRPTVIPASLSSTFVIEDLSGNPVSLSSRMEGKEKTLDPRLQMSRMTEGRASTVARDDCRVTPSANPTYQAIMPKGWRGWCGRGGFREKGIAGLRQNDDGKCQGI